MSELMCVRVAHTGVLLICGWFSTMIAYVYRRRIIVMAYNQTAKFVVYGVCSTFAVLETGAIALWLGLGIESTLATTSQLDTCTNSNLYFLGAGIFVLGAFSWPFLMDEYTSEKVEFPTKEELATFTTGSGVLVMTSALILSSYNSDGANLVLVVFVLYLCLQYVVVDMIIWTFIRQCMHKRRTKLAFTENAMQQPWTVTSNRNSDTNSE